MSIVGPTGVTTSPEIAGIPVSQLSVAPDGHAYAVITDLAGGYSVANVAPDGTVTTVSIPGTVTPSKQRRWSDTRCNRTATACVSPYTDSDTGATKIAEISHGAVVQTYTLPDGSSISQPVVTGPNGAAYQIVETATGTSVLALVAGGGQTREISGDLATVASALYTPLEVGPDGTGYLVTQDGATTRVLAFSVTGVSGMDISGTGRRRCRRTRRGAFRASSCTR